MFRNVLAPAKGVITAAEAVKARIGLPARVPNNQAEGRTMNSSYVTWSFVRVVYFFYLHAQKNNPFD